MSQDHAVLLSFFVVVVVFRRSEKDRDRESEARQALESSDNCLKSGFFFFFFFFFFFWFWLFNVCQSLKNPTFVLESFVFLSFSIVSFSQGDFRHCFVLFCFWSS